MCSRQAQCVQRTTESEGLALGQERLAPPRRSAAAAAEVVKDMMEEAEAAELAVMAAFQVAGRIPLSLHSGSWLLFGVCC